MAGMAVSIAALILIVSIMGGFGEAIKKRMLKKEAHLSLELKKKPFPLKKNSSSGLFIEKNKDLSFLNFLTPDLKNQVREAFVFEEEEIILKTSEGFKGALAIGLSPKNFEKKLIESSVFDMNSSSFTKNKFSPLSFTKKPVLVGYDLAMQEELEDKSSLHALPISSLLLPQNQAPPLKSLQVRGLLPPTQDKKEGHFVYHLQGQMDFGDFSQKKYMAHLRLFDPKKVDNFKAQVLRLGDFKIKTWKENNSLMIYSLKIEKFAMTLLFALAFLISCLGVSSSLFLLILIKAEDLALLKAMGLTGKEIVKIFSRLGLYLSFFGVFIGAFFGLLITAFFKYNKSISFLPLHYEDRFIPAIFDFKSYFVILSLVLLLSFLSSLLPVKYLSRLASSRDSVSIQIAFDEKAFFK